MQALRTEPQLKGQVALVTGAGRGLGRAYAHRLSALGARVAVNGGATSAPLGELWVKGPQVVKGYWNKPDETAKTFVDGWVKTGNLARPDEEGFCYIADRAKDMLIRGENIYCVEVENILYEHPAVVDAALVGIPHRTLGEVPAAVVTLGQRGDRQRG